MRKLKHEFFGKQTRFVILVGLFLFLFGSTISSTENQPEVVYKTIEGISEPTPKASLFEWSTQSFIFVFF